MIDSRLKNILRRLFYLAPDLPLFPENGEETFAMRSREPDKDELALGWATGEDEKTRQPIHQLKGVSQEHRDTHFYIVGASGSGKTKFLESLIKQDIENGLGFGIIDPHGDLTEHTKGYLYFLKKNEPELLQRQVVLIDPTDKNQTVVFNPLERTGNESPAAIASELTEAFKKIWKDAWGARMEDLLKNTLIALIENDLTLSDLPLFLTDLEVRRKVLERVNHQICRQYFERFNSLRRNTQDEWMESTLNKVRAFLSDEAISQMFTSPKSSFNLRKIMDEGKILLVKLDKGRLKGSADLLGSLLLAKIQAAAFSRTDILESERNKFYLYIDEFQNFATESFISMLAEARKYRLSLTLAHQNLVQLPNTLRASILSNCGLQAYFRISRDDSNILAKESLAPIFSQPPGWEWYIQQLQELPHRACVIKNKTEGGVIAIRTLDLLPPHELADTDEREFVEEVAAREIGKNYLRNREDIKKEYQARRETLTANDEPKSFREKKAGKAVNYEEMIKRGENDEVEFKSLLRWGYEQGGVSKPIEYIIAKAISAFMNAEGGTLFIGVRDNGAILGIENDYTTVSHKNKDGFLLQLTQVISQYLGKEFHQYANVKITPIGDKDICVVDISKSEMPVFLKNAGKEEFYVRASASSQQMSIREANEYIKTHFSKMDSLTY